MGFESKCSMDGRSSSSSSSSSSSDSDHEQEWVEWVEEDGDGGELLLQYYEEGEEEADYEEENDSQSDSEEAYYLKGGTVYPADPFDPEKDAKVLRKAMKGFGTDEKAIIKVIARRSNEQRQVIAQSFKTMYGKDVIKDLKSELSGNLEDLIVALMTPIAEFQAKELQKALSGVGTEEDTLIDLLCPISNAAIHITQDVYNELFGRSLESDLESDTSGAFRRLMIALCQGGRSEDETVDKAAAAKDAKSLLKAGVKKLGTDESTFNAILCTRSYPQLRRIFKEYEKKTGHSIEKAIKSEFSGDIQRGLLAIVKAATNKYEFYADRLKKSLSGMGTDDKSLIRIVVLRSEIDLQDIKAAFKDKYGKPLYKYVKKDTSGDYQKCLIEIIKH